MIDRNERNARYYKLRADGVKQADAARECGISLRTAQRLEAAARSGTTAADVEKARQGYAAKIAADQAAATAEIIDKLARAVSRIDFDELPAAETLKLLLRFMRYSRELADAAPYDALEGLQNGGKIESNADVLAAQENVLKALASGEISDDKARHLLAGLTQIRISAAATSDDW